MAIKMSNITSKIYVLFAIILILFLYNFLYAFSYYVITEGWFSEYAILLRSSKVPYVDFNLLISPLYPIFLLVVQNLFGDQFYYLRALGILVSLGILCVLFVILERLFDRRAAAMASITAAIYYQSGNAYFGYDYTQFLTLFLLIAAWFVMSAVEIRMSKTSLTPQVRRCLFAGGVFFALAILIKHSNASVAILVFGFGAAIAAARLFGWKDMLSSIAVVTLGFSLPVVLMFGWLASHGALTGFFEDVFVDAAAAKGGATTIFTGWIVGFFLPAESYFYWSWQFLLMVAILLAVSTFLALPIVGIDALRSLHGMTERPYFQVFRTHFLQTFHARKATDLWFALVVLIIGLAVVLNVGIGPKLGLPMMTQVYRWVQPVLILGSVNLYLMGFAVSLVIVLVRPSVFIVRFFLVFVLGIGLIAGNGTSAGLSEISAFMGYGLFLAALYRISAPFGLSILPVIALAIILSSVLVDERYAHPYQWWSISAPDTRNVRCAPADPLFAGICVPASFSEKLSGIKQLILAHSNAGDEIYVYPHMPVFYMLADRPPFRGAVVSWFDFMSDAQAVRLARALESHPPKVIVYALLPETVAATHERMFRANAESGQRQIMTTLANLERQGVRCRARDFTDTNGIDLRVLVPCSD